MDRDELGEIGLSLDLEGVPSAPTTVDFAISGTLGQVLSSCYDVRISITRDLTFDSLAPPAKEALTQLAMSGAADGQQPSLTQRLTESQVSEILHRNTYTQVGIPVTPTLGGNAKYPQLVGASFTQTCQVLDGHKMWDRISGEPRMVVPAMSAAVADNVPTLNLYPEISVYTDDLFFLIHSTDEPYRRDGMTQLQNQNVSTFSNQGFKVATSTITSATFSSPAREATDKNVLLLIGVLLGAVASILVALLSNGVDRLLAIPVVSKWREKATRTGRGNAGSPPPRP
ncbi:hypothetical protein [Cryobacterium zhongshanensis]|uniref:Uncharacterized protein n=1 Tax=Cryobacterium zhongshanensis TaxID=2928153 RepID=A0AA41UEL3_9MICO|nr:hypothetical protein [Cryobacterium zhongshanensis]MCI4657140.1 hypothetical protein [Cryobacterium zhongshanensis]